MSVEACVKGQKGLGSADYPPPGSSTLAPNSRGPGAALGFLLLYWSFRAQSLGFCQTLVIVCFSRSTLRTQTRPTQLSRTPTEPLLSVLSQLGLETAGWLGGCRG